MSLVNFCKYLIKFLLKFLPKLGLIIVIMLYIILLSNYWLIKWSKIFIDQTRARIMLVDLFEFDKNLWAYLELQKSSFYKKVIEQEVQLTRHSLYIAFSILNSCFNLFLFLKIAIK